MIGTAAPKWEHKGGLHPPVPHRRKLPATSRQRAENTPKTPVHSYNKDGQMRYRHKGDQPVYAPNSFHGPVADPQRFSSPSGWEVSGEIIRSAYQPHRGPRQRPRRIAPPSGGEDPAGHPAGPSHLPSCHRRGGRR